MLTAYSTCMLRGLSYEVVSSGSIHMCWLAVGLRRVKFTHELCVVW